MNADDASRGPEVLGRSVLVNPDQPTPTPWANCRRIPVGAVRAAIEANDPRHESLIDLHRAWTRREPLVIEVDALPRRTPVSAGDAFWQLHPGTEPDGDRAMFFLTANSIDLRVEQTPWAPFDDAIHLGATRGTDGCDIITPNGVPGVLDGGPLEWLNSPVAVIPRLHLTAGHLTPIGQRAASSDELDDDQRAAVEHDRGAARVIAPAGSGKTRVLTERVRLLVRSGLSPRALTLVAYNVRAQAEMESRLADIPGARISTLHALAYRIVGAAAPDAARPQVPDERDIRRILTSLVPDVRRRADHDAMEAWVDAVTVCRDTLSSPDDVENMFDGISGLDSVVVAYRHRLRREHLIDYPDMVLRACEALLADPAFLHRMRADIGMLLIDEFQDLTPSLMLLVRLLAGPAQEVFCVGDDDQTIYGFSGATPRWLVDFPVMFPGAHLHALTTNYRCPVAVVQAANTLVQHNSVRVDKVIRPANDAAPEGLSVHSCGTSAAETDMTSCVADAINSGTSPADIAVLARTNAGLIASYIHLHHAGVPVRPPVGLGPDLLRRSGVEALMAWVDLATAENLEPDSLAASLNRPRRSTTPRLTEVLLTKDNIDDLERFVSSNSNEKIARSLSDWCRDIRQVRTMVTRGATSRVLVDHLLDHVGIASTADTLDSSQRVARRVTHRDQLEAIRAVADLETRPAHLLPFLVTHLPTPADHDDAGSDRVTLDTVHRVKGLEWPHVHVIGATDGSFPHRLADDHEEERRVFHVAITRAITTVDIWATTPVSPFVGELTATPPSRPSTPPPPRRRSAPPAARTTSSSPSVGSGPLYDALVAWRLATARALSRPAFTVFKNDVLAEISTRRPTTTDDLARIAGVGPVKLADWGADIIAIVAQHSPRD